MTYVFSLTERHALGPERIVALVGSKAANLGVLGRDLGLPLPPGFVISTEACRRFLAEGWFPDLDREIQAHLADLERETGRRFGDRNAPLLVSVRSGAPVSMPGMMDTILNVGLTPEVVRSLAAQVSPDFAAGCWRTLLDQFQGTVGERLPEDAADQLRTAVRAVLQSWTGERARTYRSREGIPDDLGTAAIVQTMVFGNSGDDSATGVVFTRDPATGAAQLYGEVLFGAQGEDVVSGTRQPEPLAVLAARLPQVAATLARYADKIERHYADMCDIEFTVDRGELWLLQARLGKRTARAAVRIACDMALDPDFPLGQAEAVNRVREHLADPPLIVARRPTDKAAIATGLAASPGVASGRVATTPAAAVAMREKGEVILVRHHTSPDDVQGLAVASGVLTATGGLTSHAAVVARGWGIPAVVGAAGVAISGDTVTIGAHVIATGDVISVDGSSGEVFVGAVASAASPLPQALTLRSWAEEMGISLQTDGSAPVAAPVGPGPTRNDVLRTLRIKGLATAAQLVEPLSAELPHIEAAIDELVTEGLGSPVGAGMYQLTEAGLSTTDAAIAADRRSWGQAAAVAALDALVARDSVAKAIVGDWQMREIAGEQVVNDHSDPGHDAAVVARLRQLQDDAAVWLTEIAARYPRLATYRDRLDRAVARVIAGDTSYLASPMVDSFHNVWFELHEELILLAGRTRAEEIAAGRA